MLKPVLRLKRTSEGLEKNNRRLNTTNEGLDKAKPEFEKDTDEGFATQTYN